MKKKDLKVKVYYAKEHSKSQKIVLEILRDQKYDENNKIISLDR